MRRFLCLCLIALCLTACGGEVRVSDVTGIAGATSRQQVISDHPHHVLIGQAMILRRGAELYYVVEIGQTWDGVHRRLRMDTAWHNQEPLTFRGMRRTERFCRPLGNCLGYRVGLLGFTAAGFAEAAETGVEATLIGPDAVIEIHIRPGLFAEALERAVTSGMLSDQVTPPEPATPPSG